MKKEIKILINAINELQKSITPLKWMSDLSEEELKIYLGDSIINHKPLPTDIDLNKVDVSKLFPMIESAIGEVKRITADILLNMNISEPDRIFIMNNLGAILSNKTTKSLINNNDVVQDLETFIGDLEENYLDENDSSFFNSN
jgi:hypothetical protein